MMREMNGVIEEHVKDVGGIDNSLLEIKGITEDSTRLIDDVYAVSQQLKEETRNLGREVSKIKKS
jgi:methyl-accepting chemotaxis protein